MSYSNEFMKGLISFVSEMESELDSLKEKLEEAWSMEKKLNHALGKKDEEIRILEKENARLKASSLADKEVLKKALELIREAETKTSLHTLGNAANAKYIEEEFESGEVVAVEPKEEFVVKPSEGKIDIEVSNDRQLKISMYA